MIRILLDQGLPRSTAFYLSEQKWDVLHVGDIGLCKAKDREILECARVNYRTIITLDSDFHTFLAVSNASSPSVVRLRIEGLRAPDLAKLIKTIWPKIEMYLEVGAMITINEKTIRIRELPIMSNT